MLTGGTYLASNGSVVWKGLGFSANGPYDCAFALTGNGTEVGRWLGLEQGREGQSLTYTTNQAVGYYTFLDQLNASTPAGETGPWLLYYEREPTREECTLVYRNYKCNPGSIS